MGDRHVRVEPMFFSSGLHRPAPAESSASLLDTLLQLLEQTHGSLAGDDKPQPPQKPPTAVPEGSIDDDADTRRKNERPRPRRDIARATASPNSGETDSEHEATIPERVRALNAAEQQKLAHRGDLTERKLLERCFGKAVWEALLKNPKVTPPEVATMARKGSLPIPLLELIVNNRAWVATPIVRRALLTNPRLRGSLVTQVLAATPRPELKLMVKQTAYPASVREAATKMLR